MDGNVALKEEDVSYRQQRARPIFILAQNWHLCAGRQVAAAVMNEFSEVRVLRT